MTNEEKELMLKEFRMAYVPDVVTPASIVRNKEDYCKRQPRVDPERLNYNFEQFKRYSYMLRKARQVDEVKSTHFYKIVKYVKENKENKSDPLVRDFTVTKGYDPDLIEIPQEF